jgi:two-component system LytT family response regulator
MKIRAIIVDDEKDARDSLNLMIDEFYSSDVEIVDSVSSVSEAVKSINSFKPDLVFLDIEMPKETGLQLFEYFNDNYEFEVVFITAFQKYALTAFRYAALDYLLKPLDYRQLGETIERFRKKSFRNTKVRIETYFNNMSSALEINKKILFPSNNGYNIVKINNIIYCQAEINYSTAYTSEGKSYTMSHSLKYLEEMLPPAIFFRTHKSYLVNLNYVKSFDKKRGVAILESNKAIDVASRRVDEFIKALRVR